MVVAGAVMLAGSTAAMAQAVGELLLVAVAITAMHLIVYLVSARALGVPVYAVFLGGGPRVIGVQRGAVALEMRALPVGGTVAFYPDDVEPGDAEDPPPQSVFAMLLAAPMASVVVAAVLLGPGVAESLGLIPAQLWALMMDPSGVGRDVAFSALHLTDESLPIVFGTVAAKLGVVQIPANLLLIGRSAAELLGGEPPEGALIALGITQVALTTWCLFGFVYALSLVLEV